jgi:hypothetical protein
MTLAAILLILWPATLVLLACLCQVAGRADRALGQSPDPSGVRSPKPYAAQAEEIALAPRWGESGVQRDGPREPRYAYIPRRAST